VTITFVRVDRDMSRALVLFTSLGEAEDEAKEALEAQRVRLQAAIGRQASMRRTPELRFEVDHVVETGNRIEQLLREAPPVRTEHPSSPTGATGCPRRPTGTAPLAPPEPPNGPAGLLVVDKEPGCTSHDVVAQAGGGSAPRRSGTRGPSTPTPPACSSSAWGRRRAC
jgi:hypothetical protein